MPWWGPAPGWEAQFIERAAHSKRLQVILVGDAAKFVPDEELPRIPVSMDQFEERAMECTGVRVHKTARARPRGQVLCSLRSMMADMFPGILASCSWWGYGDWDVVWGDWDSFLTDERLVNYDMISSNEKTVNGPFSLFRNAWPFTQLYKRRLDLVASPEMHYLDESEMDAIVRHEQAAGRIRCLYAAGINAHDRHELWNRCQLTNGKLYRMDAKGNLGGEIMKFHFPSAKRWPLEG